MRSRLVSALLAVAVVATATAGLATPAAAATAAKDPVVIVPGMIGTGPIASSSYIPTAQKLRSAGYDTSIYTDPLFGLGDITENAGRLKGVVAAVLKRTGASKVNLVTHSQGGLVARAFIKYYGGADKVRALVTLAATHHGTVLSSLANAYLLDCLGLLGCSQQARDSDFLTKLNEGDDSLGDVRYTAIATRYDEVAVPYTTGFLDAADGNITNVDVQSQCPARVTEHFSIIINGAVLDGVLDALAGRPVRLNCWAIF